MRSAARRRLVCAVLSCSDLPPGSQRTQYPTQPTLSQGRFCYAPAASQAHPGESPRCASAPPLTRSPLLRCRGWHGFAKVCPVSAAGSGAGRLGGRFRALFAGRQACRVHYFGLVGVARCHFVAWRALPGALSRAGGRCSKSFWDSPPPEVPGRPVNPKTRQKVVVLGFTPSGRPYRAHQSQNDLEQLLYSNPFTSEYFNPQTRASCFVEQLN